MNVRSLTLLACALLPITLCSKPSLEVVKSDIMSQPVDAIVNAANVYLKAGGGVCGAIFKAAGHEQLQEACNEHKGTKGIRCAVGDARITRSFNLEKVGIQYIIHAVGPDGRKITDETVQYDLLVKAYTASLMLAEEYKLASIAFPFISSGMYQIDQELAAKAAIDAVQKFSPQATYLKIVRFTLFSNSELKLFQKLLHERR